MITLRKTPGEKYLELGGGSNPKLVPKCMGGTDICVDVRTCYDEQGRQTVDFTADFNEPLPIQESEFDGVFSHFAMEHISYRKVPQFVSEIHRILKPGGKAVICIPNTKAQLEWIQKHPEGWDGKDSFTSASELLFGSQDYTENTHKAYFDPELVKALFASVGFSTVTVTPYGARDTDMCIEAVKPALKKWNVKVTEELRQDMHSPSISYAEQQFSREFKPNILGTNVAPKEEMTSESRAALFDKNYFNGGGKVGGYAREGYRDFPVHEVTVQHILARKPESVLEIGCARGYHIKRLQDRNIRACGMEISHHCWLTRCCEGIIEFDICNTPWPWKDGEFDLCFSLATLEHIPEKYLPAIISEMKRVSRRQLHGIDFGANDDGFDKTHCTLKPKEWWQQRFGVGEGVEILDKEDLERGDFPKAILEGDGKVKLNIGCHSLMFHNGWHNIDLNNLEMFAQQNGYRYSKLDVTKGGLPYTTSSVDLIYTSHMLEHLTYKEGLAFLRDCRRVLKPEGAMRIIVPDASYLCRLFTGSEDFGLVGLTDLHEISNGCEEAPTPAAKLWSLLVEGHKACYDGDTLKHYLKQAGFDSQVTHFRMHGDFNGKNHPALRQILTETLDNFPCISLYVDAIPFVS